ncbi:hypothetical protein KC19_2G107100 [Ceratodon purpureus]|uniref:Uncharacterized protein n=1 Tax=Ceratodon purpureus TaxID=3225 RepID=A0A8T0IVF5_CERPU|nr:hypothetical protein KC19_2G107100 [Ceratodon purpureus]
MAGKIVKATMGLGLDSKAYEDGKPHPHPQIEDLVNTVGFSLVKELIQYLKGPEGAEALEIILEKQSRVVSNLATTNEARQATRVAAQEFIVGSYDAVQRKWLEFYKQMPSAAPYLALLLAGYVVLLAVGFLLSCWRFAFYGLH